VNDTIAVFDGVRASSGRENARERCRARSIGRSRREVVSSAVDDDEWRARAADGDVQHHRHAYCRCRIVDYKKLRNNSDVAQ